MFLMLSHRLFGIYSSCELSMLSHTSRIFLLSSKEIRRSEEHKKKVAKKLVLHHFYRDIVNKYLRRIKNVEQNRRNR